MEPLCSTSAVAAGLLPSRVARKLGLAEDLFPIYFPPQAVNCPALMQPCQGGILHGNVGVGGTESHETLPVPWDTFIIHGIWKISLWEAF